MAYVVEKAGLHYAVIYEGANPITGKERRRWHRCGTRADAETLACQLGDQRTRRRRAGSTMNLGDYLLGQWIPTREAALSPATHARYVTSVEHYLLPHLGHVQLRQLHGDQFVSLYRRLALTGSRTGGPLAAKTILNLHQLVRTALDTAVARDLILHNPAADVRAPDPRRRPSQRRRAASWTAAELGAFLEATRANRHWMLFRLAAATGMRRGELLGLRWSDVHLDTGRLGISQALTAVGYKTAFSRLKTKTSRRCVTLDSETVEQLAAWRLEQAGTHKTDGVTNTLGLVFTGSRGGPLHPHLASQAFGRAHRTSRRDAHPSTRSQAYPRQLVAARSGADQGRLRTTRALQPGVHHDDLPARPARHARRRGTGLRHHPRRTRANVDNGGHGIGRGR